MGGRAFPPQGPLRREDGLKPTLARKDGAASWPQGLLRREDGLKPLGGPAAARRSGASRAIPT